MNLGNSLFQARKKRGLSQEDVAEKLGVSRQTISKWETDETVPDIYQAKKMALLYGITLDELLSFDVELARYRRPLRKRTSRQRKPSTGQAHGERNTPFCFAIRRKWMHKAMPANWVPCWMNCARNIITGSRTPCWF